MHKEESMCRAGCNIKLVHSLLGIHNGIRYAPLFKPSHTVHIHNDAGHNIIIMYTCSEVICGLIKSHVVTGRSMADC